MFVDIGAGFKSMVGGELKGMSKLTRDVRNELIEEAAQKATEMGANAITGMYLYLLDEVLNQKYYWTSQSQTMPLN